jgi:transposase, IS30 family
VRWATKPTRTLKHYEHLTSETRSQIELLRKQGKGPTAIGLALGRAKSTISRELRRLHVVGETLAPYAWSQAQSAATKLRSKARRPQKLTPALEADILEGLAQHWSPQQIAGRWVQEGREPAQRLSHESIYAWIWRERREGGRVWQLLPRGGKKRRRDRCGTKRGHRLKVLPEQELSARPAAINERQEPGHWEVDLVIGAGQQGVLLVAVERQSRKVKLAALPSKEATVARVALIVLLGAELVFSLTYDRGLE